MTTILQNNFEQGTKNAEIFNTTAPYSNTYQGSDPRWLFVCSAGLLRSPTGAALAVRKGINARSCGSDQHYALIPLSANLIMWAEKIVFVSSYNHYEATQTFQYHDHLLHWIEDKALVLNIPDKFNYNHPDLIAEFEKQIDWVRAVGGKTTY
jgi:predicted protein tyrosine phosphatase